MRSLLICCLLCFQAATAFSQDFDYVENAVYIYNFIKYTSWPQKKQDIVVGVIGKTPAEAELRKLLSAKSGSQSFSVQNITPADARSVDVILIAYNAAAQTKDLKSVKRPILIITEKEDMGHDGACISFYRDEDNELKTGYQLSIRNCKERGLKIGQQILDYAVLMR